MAKILTSKEIDPDEEIRQEEAKIRKRILKMPILLVTQSLQYRFTDQYFFYDNASRYGKKAPISELLVERKSGNPREWRLDDLGQMYPEDETASELEDFLEYFHYLHLPYASREKTLAIVQKHRRSIRQRLRGYYINREGRYISENDVCVFPDRLYLQFGHIDTDAIFDFYDFVTEHNFCCFSETRRPYIGIIDEPWDTPEQMQKIKNTKYNEKECDSNRKKNWIRNADYFSAGPTASAEHANIVQLFQDHIFLSGIMENFKKGKVTTKNVQFLRSIVGKDTQKIYFDSEFFDLLEEVDPDKDPPKKHTFIDPLNIVLPIPENYREVLMVFGHYALCCLELLTEIENTKNTPRICAMLGCSWPLPSDAHGSQQFCLPLHNRTCFNKRKALEKCNRKKKRK